MSGFMSALFDPGLTIFAAASNRDVVPITLR